MVRPGMCPGNPTAGAQLYPQGIDQGIALAYSAGGGEATMLSEKPAAGRAGSPVAGWGGDRAGRGAPDHRIYGGQPDRAFRRGWG